MPVLGRGRRREMTQAGLHPTRSGSALGEVVGRALIALIQVYQWTFSPLLGACCRFEPSCSRYTVLCIERLGPFRGALLGLRRLLRCHPFCPGGHDPPPELTS